MIHHTSCSMIIQSFAFFFILCVSINNFFLLLATRHTHLLLTYTHAHTNHLDLLDEIRIYWYIRFLLFFFSFFISVLLLFFLFCLSTAVGSKYCTYTYSRKTINFIAFYLFFIEIIRTTRIHILVLEISSHFFIVIIKWILLDVKSTIIIVSCFNMVNKVNFWEG